ncbi:GNAT family N-acetyltransferase [Curtobacterium albidum]|uniref:GNAT family N-acetyltransferase n=1 Tax=Curtobacterium citreum TaxID=2036 RepID=A0A850DTC4_9MICO|nr:GNAT family N-acetyltransferase [Curtobacterium sp. BH-2-1-1]NUU27778.1 GNAT family N-acetyltransferase [Curtobacterium albidum]
MVTIARVSPSDAVAGRIVRAYLTDVASRWHGRTASEDEVDRALADEPFDDLVEPSGVLLVASDGGQAVGCAGARFLGNVAELTKVFVSPTRRGTGLGAALLRAVEAACREQGVAVLRLDTRAALAEACALYERSGFERVAPFNADPYADRWYRKVLEP